MSSPGVPILQQTPVRPWVVFADDWGRHPSSCQYLVRRQLGQRPINWINTIGTRPPRLDLSTVKRAAGKLRSWFGPRQQQAQEAGLSPVVLSPKMYPSFGSRLARTLNRSLLRRVLRGIVDAAATPPAIITTLPLVADLVDDIPTARWVYYCVDDFSVWPGYDGPTMQRLEAVLVPKVQQVIAVSETLQQHLTQYGVQAKLLTHGVDLATWTDPPSVTLPAEFARLEKPWVVFWGVIDRRMDTAFLRHLNERMHRGTILLVGPQEDPDPAVVTLPRVTLLPSQPFAVLPVLAREAATLIMPYADLPVTRAIQPLKLKEYLATGQPSVVRALPSTLPWADCADVCGTPEEFTQLVLQRIETGLPPEQGLARQRLQQESWDAKAREFEVWVNGEESAGNDSHAC